MAVGRVGGASSRRWDGSKRTSRWRRHAARNQRHAFTTSGRRSSNQSNCQAGRSVVVPDAIPGRLEKRLGGTCANESRLHELNEEYLLFGRTSRTGPGVIRRAWASKGADRWLVVRPRPTCRCLPPLETRCSGQRCIGAWPQARRRTTSRGFADACKARELARSSSRPSDRTRRACRVRRLVISADGQDESRGPFALGTTVFSLHFGGPARRAVDEGVDAGGRLRKLDEPGPDPDPPGRPANCRACAFPPRSRTTRHNDSRRAPSMRSLPSSGRRRVGQVGVDAILLALATTCVRACASREHHRTSYQERSGAIGSGGRAGFAIFTPRSASTRELGASFDVRREKKKRLRDDPQGDRRGKAGLIGASSFLFSIAVDKTRSAASSSWTSYCRCVARLRRDALPCVGGRQRPARGDPRRVYRTRCDAPTPRVGAGNGEQQRSLPRCAATPACETATVGSSIERTAQERECGVQGTRCFPGHRRPAAGARNAVQARRGDHRDGTIGPAGSCGKRVVQPASGAAANPGALLPTTFAACGRAAVKPDAPGAQVKVEDVHGAQRRAGGDRRVTAPICRAKWTQ